MISKRKDIKWVSPKSPRLTVLNTQSRDLVEVNQLQKSPFNLTGEGFTAAVWDGGWAGNHEDLNYTDSKLVIGDKGENCDESPSVFPDHCSIIEHSTHVSGTLLGAGILNEDYRGVAPNTSLVSYEWPDDSTELLSETKEAVNQFDSVLSQNSWGYNVDASNQDIMGDYMSLSDDYDSIIANQTSIDDKVSIVFSAGNERADSSDDIDPSYNSTTSPGGTAKNTITVGAVDDWQI